MPSRQTSSSYPADPRLDPAGCRAAPYDPSPRVVLVTGASGFVGANLVRHLVVAGHEVHCLLRPRRDLWRLEGVFPAIRVHHGSVSDSDAVNRTINAVRPAWVFHSATYGAYPDQSDYDRAFEVNVEGTLHLVRSCLESGAEAVICAGSSSEYGPKDHRSAESDALDPRSAYAATKAAATLLIRYWAIQRQAPVVVLRLYSVYGPWEEPSRLIPRVAAHGLAGLWPPLANPDTARDFVYVSDVAAAMVAASQRAPSLSPGSVFNIGTGRQTTLASVARIAKRTFHLASGPIWGTMQDRAWDTPIWVADARRARAQLGWVATIPFHRGLRLTADWLTAHPELWPRYAPVSCGAAGQHTIGAADHRSLAPASIPRPVPRTRPHQPEPSPPRA